jgi:hypothetical protein
MTQVKHRVTIAESVQVYPYRPVTGQYKISHIEITVTAGLNVLYGPGKVFENAAVLAAYELYLVQGSHELLLAAWKEIRVTFGAEKYLAVAAHDLCHLFYALRLIVTDT